MRELKEGQGERLDGRAERGMPPDMVRGVEVETEGRLADLDG